jgi:hypothetical protein
MYMLTSNCILDTYTDVHSDHSFDDVDWKGLSFFHTNCIVLACGQPYNLVITMIMFWPEQDNKEDKISFQRRKVGLCHYSFGGSLGFHTSILSPVGAGRHGIFAMIDPKDHIKKLILFQHETRVNKQIAGYNFTTRGFIILDFTFDTAMNAKKHFNQFGNHPSYCWIIDQMQITTICKDPI